VEAEQTKDMTGQMSLEEKRLEKVHQVFKPLASRLSSHNVFLFDCSMRGCSRTCVTVSATCCLSDVHIHWTGALANMQM